MQMSPSIKQKNDKCSCFIKSSIQQYLPVRIAHDDAHALPRAGKVQNSKHLVPLVHETIAAAAAAAGPERKTTQSEETCFDQGNATKWGKPTRPEEACFDQRNARKCVLYVSHQKSTCTCGTNIDKRRRIWQNPTHATREGVCFDWSTNCHKITEGTLVRSKIKWVFHQRIILCVWNNRWETPDRTETHAMKQRGMFWLVNDLPHTDKKSTIRTAES